MRPIYAYIFQTKGWGLRTSEGGEAIIFSASDGETIAKRNSDGRYTFFKALHYEEIKAIMDACWDLE